jgi:hypothetical protein
MHGVPTAAAVGYVLPPLTGLAMGHRLLGESKTNESSLESINIFYRAFVIVSKTRCS